MIGDLEDGQLCPCIAYAVWIVLVLKLWYLLYIYTSVKMFHVALDAQFSQCADAGHGTVLDTVLQEPRAGMPSPWHTAGQYLRYARSRVGQWPCRQWRPNPTGPWRPHALRCGIPAKGRALGVVLPMLDCPRVRNSRGFDGSTATGPGPSCSKGVIWSQVLEAAGYLS